MPGSGGGTRRELGQRGDSRAWNAAGIQVGSGVLPGLEGAGVPAVGSAVCGQTSRMFWGGRGQRKVPALALQGADAEAWDIADVHSGDA